MLLISSCFSSAFCIFLKTKLIEEEIVIFVCATTGQGDEPDNMKVGGQLPSIYFLFGSAKTSMLNNLSFT